MSYKRITPKEARALESNAIKFLDAGGHFDEDTLVFASTLTLRAFENSRLREDESHLAIGEEGHL